VANEAGPGDTSRQEKTVPVDTSVAHVAPVFDYWLGGKDNFAADREVGEQTLRSNPDLALSGGDDYELLFCLRPRISEAELSRRLGVKVGCIGEITREKRALLVSGTGKPAVMRNRGWDQLRAT